MSLPHLLTAVVLPVGPRVDPVDAIESVLCYLEPPRHVFIVDDVIGGNPRLDAFRAHGEVTVLERLPGLQNVLGTLWWETAAAYRLIAERYEAQLVLRLDTDALILGRGIERLALERFAREPDVGLLGSYRVDALGERRDFGPAARILRNEIGPLGLRDPRLRRRLRALVGSARANGYVLGEHCLGAGMLHSGVAVRAIYERGIFHLSDLARSRLADDHLMGLVTVAAGYRMGDFGGPDDPIAIKWKGLPYGVEELQRRAKLLTHSVRGRGAEDEASIREYFRAKRMMDLR